MTALVPQLLARKRLLSYRAQVLADSPLAFWMLGEASGTSAADASGNSRTATYVNSPTLAQTSIIPTTADTSILLNGTSDLLAVTSASWMDVASITVELVMNSPMSGVRAVIARDDNTNRDWYLVTVGTDVYWGTRNTSGTLVEVGPITLAANTTAHIACTFTASGTAKIYRNGAEVASASVSGNLRTAGAPITIGRYLVASGYYAGKLQGVAVHGSALTAARILAHAQSAGLA